MTQQPWADDPALVADLREALAAREALPAAFAAAARAAFTWRTINEDLLLAELSFDSALPQGALATRSGANQASRMLVFDGGGYRIDAELDGAGGVIGQITPAGPGTMRCETPEATFDEGPIDEVGCFSIRAPGTGVLRLHATVDGRPIATAWLNLGGPRP
ncbi:hypothetical protein [Actinoplanes sp. NPDC049599]|uniref:hypothetical protein n=1 Tax=Actinoplanes sp. NPDC049599 TaxID=3363903 RepID=UPI0037B061D3